MPKPAIKLLVTDESQIAAVILAKSIINKKTTVNRTAAITEDAIFEILSVACNRNNKIRCCIYCCNLFSCLQKNFFLPALGLRLFNLLLNW